MMREPIERPKPSPTMNSVVGQGFGYWSSRRTRPSRNSAIAAANGASFGIDEHVAVVERAGGEQHERKQSGKRAADAAADPPGDGEAGDADRGAEQPPGFEQIERQHLGQQRRRHVEAAAVEIEIDERQRAGVVEARSVERQQQVAVLRVGEVVPAEPIVAEGERGDQTPARRARHRPAGRASGFACASAERRCSIMAVHYADW